MDADTLAPKTAEYEYNGKLHAVCVAPHLPARAVVLARVLFSQCNGEITPDVFMAVIADNWDRFITMLQVSSPFSRVQLEAMQSDDLFRLMNTVFPAPDETGAEGNEAMPAPKE